MSIGVMLDLAFGLMVEGERDPILWTGKLMLFYETYSPSHIYRRV